MLLSSEGKAQRSPTTPALRARAHPCGMRWHSSWNLFATPTLEDMQPLLGRTRDSGPGSGSAGVLTRCGVGDFRLVKAILRATRFSPGHTRLQRSVCVFIPKTKSFGPDGKITARSRDR